MMTKRVFFRADKRPFKSGDPIGTAGEFMSKHPEKGKLAEAALEKSRPRKKPKRQECLMLFEDEECARDHWAKMADGRLYRVEIDDDDILHRGDMKLVDAIGETLSKSAAADVSKEMTKYWNGEDCGGCMETLARHGVVLEELGDEKSRIERFKKLIGFSRSPELEPFQEEMERLIPGWGKTYE
jgi:hypothetical protein